MWISSYILAMVVSLIQYRLFPGEMETINEGLNDVIYSVPFWVSVIVVALLPAICEEAVHRGVIIHTMYRIRKEWLVVLIMGIYFGLFHANPLRFLPTAILGAVMSYIMLETENMVYSSAFHMINNLVPMVLQAVLKDLRAGRRERLGKLQVVCCSSAMFRPEDLAELASYGILVMQIYASTETCACGLFNAAQDTAHIGAVGQACFGTQYRIAPDGELCIRGDMVTKGYYKDPTATAEVLDADGWFHTGDLARTDKEGYYYITGRKKNLIILDSGENESPEELEKLLSGCTAVQECLVQEKGQKICAQIFCPQADQAAVRDFVTQLNRTLPMYKRITALVFRDEPLPRNAAGKLDRQAPAL